MSVIYTQELFGYSVKLTRLSDFIDFPRVKMAAEDSDGLKQSIHGAFLRSFDILTHFLCTFWSNLGPKLPECISFWSFKCSKQKIRQKSCRQSLSNIHLPKLGYVFVFL